MRVYHVLLSSPGMRCQGKVCVWLPERARGQTLCRTCAVSARDGLDGDRFGSSYIGDSFTPHISLAKLDRDDQAEAVAIGRQALSNADSTRPRTLDLCDIGENSERWDILASFPATSHPQAGDSATLAR